MIGKFFEWIYTYRVKQELLAQMRDVSFVEYVVNIPSNREGLIHLYRNAYYGAGKIAPFMAAIFVLEETIGMEQVPIEIKKSCATLLAQRLLKAQANRSFWMAHIMIFGRAEETVQHWISRFEEHSSR